MLAIAAMVLAIAVRFPAKMAVAAVSAPAPALVQTSLDSLQQGRQLYEAGQLAAAVQIWQQAEAEYQRQGDASNRALVLNYLSSAYQDLGDWEAARSSVDRSLELLAAITQPTAREVGIRAQALNTQGSLQLALGQTEMALETWQQAEAEYDRIENATGKLGAQMNQASALKALGKYQRAQTLLETVAEQLQAQPDSLLKADGLRSLGETWHAIGNLAQAKAILEQSWGISQRLAATEDTGATLMSLGSLARDLRRYDVALSYYQEAVKKVRSPLAQLQIQLNQLGILTEQKQTEKALQLVGQIQTALSEFSPSRSSVYARVNLAENWMKLTNNSRTIAENLATAIAQAKSLNDPRSTSAALSQLGKLYERDGQWKDAQNLTEQALQIAQSINGNDLIARSAWQLGRILKAQGKTDDARAAYGYAYETLKSLRSDLVAMNSEVQFSFKESVEPIYRDYVSLLLTPNASQENLQKARAVIEGLQLAELDNFFKEACLETRPVQIDQIDPQAAVIYPIILSDRLEVILSIPQQPLRHYAISKSADEIEGVVRQLYSSLYLGYSKNDRLHLATQVYDWLIRPAEADLARDRIETLVFVLDGWFRSIPMAALYDGQRYLIESYSLALSPGLQLLPEGSASKELNILAAGLTEARQGFPALPGVQEEVKTIAAEVKAQVLLDGQFTQASFQEQLDATSFPVVHIATHGQFSSNPEETFLLTWDDRIDVKDFDRILQNPERGTNRSIDLLVMSACQTAAGDRRATLGLAGLALRSGARSTLASLWAVSDNSTAQLMSEFYHQLAQQGVQPNITKAQALRQAQLSLLKNPQYNHPYYWAAFVLIGNWL
jgi:CHAT domain-containing protein